MKTKAQFVMGREEELKVLFDYITTGHCDSPGALREHAKEEDEDEEKKEKREKQLQEGFLTNYQNDDIIIL